MTFRKNLKCSVRRDRQAQLCLAQTPSRVARFCRHNCCLPNVGACELSGSSDGQTYGCYSFSDYSAGPASHELLPVHRPARDRDNTSHRSQRHAGRDAANPIDHDSPRRSRAARGRARARRAAGPGSFGPAWGLGDAAGVEISVPSTVTGVRRRGRFRSARPCEGH